MSGNETWSFTNCRDEIAQLRGRHGFSDLPYLDLLDLRLDLRSGALTAGLSGTPYSGSSKAVFCILATYSRAADVAAEAFRPVPFSQLPGGTAYDAAFRSRAVLPLAARYSRDPGSFRRVVELLGGVPVAFADHAWKLPALPRVPVYILIWEGSDEFPASASLLFDATVSSYLPTEAAAMLGELVTERIVSHYSRTGRAE